jgi:Zn-finger protein
MPLGVVVYDIENCTLSVFYSCHFAKYNLLTRKPYCPLGVLSGHTTKMTFLISSELVWEPVDPLRCHSIV